MILEAAGELGFRPSRRLARTDPELVAPIIAVERALEDDRMRAAVQKVVADAIGRAVADGHHDLVVIGHSLGSIVAYDLCSDFTASIRVRLLVTAGSPLGYPIVRRNLRGGAEGVDDRSVPAVLDPIPGTPGRDRVWWLNAFDVLDVLDVVALVHPLASRFSDGGQRIRDERTFNPTYPHSIADYLSDPDVAGPIGDVLARG
jgi:pimeloyl-ACP methyl ester carboxylesterase